MRGKLLVVSDWLINGSLKFYSRIAPLLQKGGQLLKRSENSNLKKKFNQKLQLKCFSIQVLEIWSEPAAGSCPCSLDPVGLLSYEITGLEAGRDFEFFMQLTSAYGKKGPVTSFKVATYTDVVSSIVLHNTRPIRIDCAKKGPVTSWHSKCQFTLTW